MRCSVARTSPITPRRALERSPDPGLAPHERRKALLERPNALLGGLRAPRRLNQRSSEPRAVGLDFRNLTLELALRLRALRERLIERPEVCRAPGPFFGAQRRIACLEDVALRKAGLAA
jgi:hypothetical protein